MVVHCGGVFVVGEIDSQTMMHGTDPLGSRHWLD